MTIDGSDYETRVQQITKYQKKEMRKLERSFAGLETMPIRNIRTLLHTLEMGFGKGSSNIILGMLLVILFVRILSAGICEARIDFVALGRLVFEYVSRSLFWRSGLTLYDLAFSSSYCLDGVLRHLGMVLCHPCYVVAKQLSVVTSFLAILEQ